MVLATAIGRLREQHAARRSEHAERRIVEAARRFGRWRRQWDRALDLNDEHRASACPDGLETGVELRGRAHEVAAAASLLAQLAQIGRAVGSSVRRQSQLRLRRVRHLTRRKPQHNAEYTLIPSERLGV